MRFRKQPPISIKTPHGRDVPQPSVKKQPSFCGHSTPKDFLPSLSSTNAPINKYQEFYRQLTDQAPDAILLLDVKLNISYANPVAEKLLGFLKGEKRCHSLLERIDGEEKTRIKDLLEKALSGHSFSGVDVDWACPQAPAIPVEISVIPLPGDSKADQLYVTIRDMRRRKRREELLCESERIKTIQHIISGAGQELMFPLKGLADHFENLLEKYKTREFEYIGFKEFKDIFKSLETMRDQVNDCFKTINRLLAMNRNEGTSKDHPCEVNSVIRHTVKAMEHLIHASNAHLELKLAPKPIRVLMNGLDFQHVLTNVITNAVQSLSGGGKVLIKSSILKDERQVEIVCKDWGIGISKESLSQVFEPFFTTKKNAFERNSGLGLAVVRTIVNNYDGDVLINSKPNHGTTVRIHIPLAKR